MSSVARLAEIGALIGDPARCAMLVALMDGRALTASELARVAGVTPPTASSHLAQLSQANLLCVIRQGRHRYHQIASAEVARMLEGLMAVASRTGAPPRAVATGPRDKGMRHLRTCYDHLAGQLAVAMADSMAARGEIVLGPDGGRLTPAGEGLLAKLSIRLAVEPVRLVRPCLDWSERRPHLAGAIGAALCARCLDMGWLRRRDGTRALLITPAGEQGFRARFGVALRAA